MTDKDECVPVVEKSLEYYKRSPYIIVLTGVKEELLAEVQGKMWND